MAAKRARTYRSGPHKGEPKPPPRIKGTYRRKPKPAPQPPLPEGAPPRRGRPTSYSKEFADFICDTYGAGTTPITILCRDDERFPTHDTLDTWCEKHEYIFAKLQRADRKFAKNLAEHTVVLADSAFGDVLGTDKYGRPIVNNEIVARSKIRIGVRQWLASRMDAGRWGDRSSHAITGADGGPVLSFVDLVKLSTAARKPEGDGS